jgi:hypothetical protein
MQKFLARPILHLSATLDTFNLLRLCVTSHALTVLQALKCMSLRKLYIAVVLVCALSMAVTGCHRPRRQQDRVVLQSSEVRVGRIIALDSAALRLKVQGEGETVIPIAEIDSVIGQNFKTRFVSLSTGIMGFKYYSPFLAELDRLVAMPLQLRWGKLHHQRWAHAWQFSVLPQRDFTVTKFGYAYQFYAYHKYTAPFNAYLALMPELNNVRYNNKLFLTFSTSLGASYLLKNKVRIWSELVYQRPLWNINRQSSVGLVVGVRLHREFSKYYRTINARFQ